jgi:hypothetical protein
LFSTGVAVMKGGKLVHITGFWTGIMFGGNVGLYHSSWKRALGWECMNVLYSAYDNIFFVFLCAFQSNTWYSKAANKS